jgi:AcrR family transcriptional regulator
MAPGAAAADKPVSLREVQRSASRQHLLGASRRVFQAKGYLAATIDDLVEAAGMSRATFYTHFTSKSELVQEIIEETRLEVLELYGRLDDALANASIGALRRWMEDTVDWSIAHAWLMPAWDEAKVNDPTHREQRQETLLWIPEAMPKYLAACRPADRGRAVLRLRLLVVQMSAYFNRYRGDVSGMEARDVLVEELTDIWHTTLRPRSSGAGAKKGSASAT